MPKYLRSNKSRGKRLNWQTASDIKKRTLYIVDSLQMDWVDKKNIYCYRSSNSTSRAYARIWGFSKVWQLALKREPAYIIEVISEKFDRLNEKQKEEVLLHELAHIPKNFSGSLLPHVRKRGKRNFEDRVKNLVKRYRKL